MKKRRKKIRRKRAHKEHHRRPSAAGTAARIKLKKAPTRTGGRPPAPQQFLEVKKFILMDMDAHPRKLFESLRKRKNAVFVVTDTSRKRPLYYLSSSDALRASFRRTGVSPAPLSTARPPRVADVLRTGMKELIPVETVSRATISTAAPKAVGRRSGHVFVGVKNDKPSALWVSSLALGKALLPSTIRTALISAIPKVAQPAVKLPSRTLVSVEADSEPTENPTPASLPGRSVGPKRGPGTSSRYVRFEVNPESTPPLFETGTQQQQRPQYQPQQQPTESPSAPASNPGGPPPLHLPPTQELTAGSGAARPRFNFGKFGNSRPDFHFGPPKPDAPSEVYPNIRPSNEHPVQGTTFEVTVSLDFEKTTRTAGVVDTVADNAIHEFEVHLLVGDDSHWQTLTFQRSQGTLKGAIFPEVQAPALQPNEAGNVPDHAITEIYVNFYLGGRWCGEAIAQIDVRAGEKTPEFNLSPNQAPPDPPWRRGLSIRPGTPPPDLTVRIKKTGPMSFRWSMFSPHMVFDNTTGELTTFYDKPPYNFIKFKFEKLASAPIDQTKRYVLNSICDEIFRAAPLGFRIAYRALRIEEKNDQRGRIKLETILFISDDPYIPWELMRVSDASSPKAFDPEVLAVRHVIGRWVASDVSELRTALTVHKITVIATDYSGQNVASFAQLPGAKIERDFLTATPYNASPVPVRYDDVRDYLYGTGSEAPPAEIIHFSCHGITDVQDPDEAMLGMEDRGKNDGFKATLAASQEAVAGAGALHPLVFLNACQAAASGDAFGFVFGWPQAFLEMGATACIAPLWQVVDTQAKEVAKYFYQLVLKANKQGQALSIGEAVRQIRLKWTSDETITSLAYVLYGDPTAMLTWTP